MEDSNIMQVSASMPMPTDKIFCGDVPLAMAYVPMQRWEGLYEPPVGFVRGTIFKALDLPFLGEEAVERGR